MLFLFCYDIVDDGIRLKVAKLMESCGARVQKSVFECELDRRQMNTVRKRALKLIDLKSDSLRIYRLCASCAGRIEHNGRNIEGLHDEAPIA
jgi:CRISPR-associated protein Cas2